MWLFLLRLNPVIFSHSDCVLFSPRNTIIHGREAFVLTWISSPKYNVATFHSQLEVNKKLPLFLSVKEMKYFITLMRMQSWGQPQQTAQTSIFLVTYGLVLVKLVWLIHAGKLLLSWYGVTLRLTGLLVFFFATRGHEITQKVLHFLLCSQHWLFAFFL